LKEEGKKAERMIVEIQDKKTQIPYHFPHFQAKSSKKISPP
jgi:hypothetical protein